MTARTEPCSMCGGHGSLPDLGTCPGCGGHGVMTVPASSNQAKRADLYAEGKCRDCEAPLLDDELAADARYCGVCRAVRAQRKAMKRSPKTPQEIAAVYAKRIKAEQAKRVQAGLRPGGRASRDAVHAARKGRRREPRRAP